MKKVYKVILLLLFLLLLLTFLALKLYQADKYFYKRYTDRFFDIMLHKRPFGGGPYEIYEKDIYMEGIYIIQIDSRGNAHKTNAVGKVTSLNGNKISLTSFGVTDIVELRNDIVFTLQIPNKNIEGKMDILSGKLADIEIGDTLRFLDYDSKLGFEKVFIIKKYYDRDRF